MKSFTHISTFISISLCLAFTSFAQDEKVTVKEELSPYERSNSEYLLIEAQKFYLLEDYQRSLAFLDQALEVDKKNHAAFFKMAEIQLVLGDYSKGLTAIDQAIELQKDNKYYYVLAAQLHKASQNLSGAAQYYELMLSNAKRYNGYLIEISEVYEALNQLDKAIGVFENSDDKGLTLDQQSRKVDLLIKANRTAEAIDFLAQMLQENPQNTEVLYKYTYTLSANDQVEKAIPILEGNKFKTNELTLLLAENYQRTGASEKQRSLILNLHADPEASLSMKTLLLGQWAFSDDLSDKVILIDSLQEAMNLAYPDEPLVVENGGLLYSKLAQKAQGEDRLAFQNKAVLYFKRLTKLRPGDFQVWNKILAYEYQRENWESLASSSEEALDLFPNQAVFYIYLASANQGLKEFDEAEDLLRQASRMAMSNELLKSQILGKQASLSIAMGDTSKGQALFEQSVNSSQAHPESVAGYAEFLVESDPNRAAQMIDPIIDSPFKNLQFIRIKAKALFNLKNYSEANTLLTEGLNEFPSQQNGKILELSGDILFKLNLIDEALAQWKAAKKLGNVSGKLDQKIENKQYN